MEVRFRETRRRRATLQLGLEKTLAVRVRVAEKTAVPFL